MTRATRNIVGTLEMTCGSGRLVATRAGPNIPFDFDGVQLTGSIGGGKIYAFVTKPAREQKDTFDDESPAYQDQERQARRGGSFGRGSGGT